MTAARSCVQCPRSDCLMRQFPTESADIGILFLFVPHLQFPMRGTGKTKDHAGEGKMSLSQRCQALLLGKVFVLSSEGFPSVTGSSELLQQSHLAMCDLCPFRLGMEDPRVQARSDNVVMPSKRFQARSLRGLLKRAIYQVSLRQSDRRAWLSHLTARSRSGSRGNRAI